MSIAQPYQYYGYNPYSSVPYQIYPSQNIPSLQSYSYIYPNAPYSVSNTTLNQPPSLSSSKNQNSNTLFVKNLPFEMSSAKVKEMFGEYGEIAFIKSQVHDRGIAFITYYDMRSAEKAYKKLHGTEFFGRRLVVDFSFKKNNPNNQNISLFVIIEILNYSQAISLNLNIVKNFMSSFGEIYNAYELAPYKYVIQYYDFRNSQNAARYGNTLLINGVRCNISIPEEDPVMPTQSDKISTTSITAASLPKAEIAGVSANSTVGNQYTAYPQTYNPINYQQTQLQQQPVNQNVQLAYNTYQQPQQQLIQPVQQVPLQNQQALTAQPQQIFSNQPQQILTAQPQQILTAQPQQILTTQHQQILTTQPQQILTTQPQQILTTQPQQILQTQQQQLLQAQQQPILSTPPQQLSQTQHLFQPQQHQLLQAQPQQIQHPQSAPQSNAQTANQENKTTISQPNQISNTTKETLKKLNLMMSQKSAF